MNSRVGIFAVVYSPPTSGRSRIVGLVCIALALTALCAFAGSDDGEPAPRFRAKTLTGETFTNESVKGKVVLLQFWTTWCP